MESISNNLVSACFFSKSNPCKKFQLVNSAEQRLDQRLNRNERSIDSYRVAPRFEIMRRRKIPVRLFCRLVFIIAETKNSLWFYSPIQIVNRIAAENDKRISCTAVKTFQASANNFRCWNQSDRVTNRTKHNIYCVREQMNFNRLTLTSDNQSILSSRLQIAHTFVNPLHIDARNFTNNS